LCGFNDYKVQAVDLKLPW